MKIKISNIPLKSFLLIFSTVLFVACKKEISQSDTDTEKIFSELSSNANIESAQVFDDVYNNVMGVNSEVGIGETGVFGRIITMDSFVNTCFTVKIVRLISQAAFPVQVELDFGNGCKGKDGVNRKGKIITVYTGPLTVAGKAAESSFDNFYIDDTRVEGVQRIENTGNSQQAIFKVTIKDGKLTKANGNFSIWNSNNTIQQVEGTGTPNYAKDDILSISAESNASIKTDTVFFKWNSKTLEPLIKKFTCRWIVKGKVEIVQSNTGKAIIDYGNGGCDNKANLIINNSTREITLH